MSEPAAEGVVPVVPEAVGAAVVAARLGLSLATVYRMAKDHAIPHHLVGGRLLFDVQELSAWWAERSVPLRGATPVERLAALGPAPKGGLTRLPRKRERLRATG